MLYQGDMQNTPHTEDRMPIGEIAAAFGVHTKTVRRWAESGAIPSRRLPSGRRVFYRVEITPLVPTGPQSSEASA